MEARDPQHADASRTPQDIERDKQHSEGAAFHAAIFAGKGALAKRKPKQEVAAVIFIAGFVLMAEALWFYLDG